MYKVHFSDAYTTCAVGDPQGVAQEVDSEVLRFGDAIEVQIILGFQPGNAYLLQRNG